MHSLNKYHTKRAVIEPQPLNSGEQKKITLAFVYMLIKQTALVS